jgi:hypothetical protein
MKISFSYFREYFAKIYFRFSRKFSFKKIYENNENFRENLKRWIFFIIKLESTLTSGLWKINFFFHLFINFSHFDRPSKEGPGQPGHYYRTCRTR